MDEWFLKTAVMSLVSVALVGAFRAEAASPRTDGYVIIDSGWKDGEGGSPQAPFDAEILALAEAGLTISKGFPELVMGNDYAGLKPGFRLWVVGACRDKKRAEKVAKVLRTVKPGVYVRAVVMGDLKGTCPVEKTPAKRGTAGRACTRINATGRIVRQGTHWAVCEHQDGVSILGVGEPDWIELGFEDIGLGAEEVGTLSSRASRSVVCIEQEHTVTPSHHQNTALSCYARRDAEPGGVLSWDTSEVMGYPDEAACTEEEANQDFEFTSTNPDPYGTTMEPLTHTIWQVEKDIVTIVRTQPCEDATRCAYKVSNGRLQPTKECRW